MALDTPEEIQQYLILEQKSNDQLKLICEAQELPVDGERKDLINRLLNLKIQPQLDFMQPQMVALRTKVHSNEITGANEFMKRVRKVIFEGEGNKKDFSVLNGKGEPYMMAMKYAKCTLETFQYLVTSDMIYPHASQRELVRILKKDPTVFTFNLVQRSYGKNQTFIMLHVAPKAI